MANLEFTRELIKGRIAEVIFEQMFRESGKFTILKAGYENTLPELAQYHHLVEVQKVLDNIRHSPDFILISQDKTEVYLVEVKYRAHPINGEVKEIAGSILEKWNPSWLFLASPSGFFFEPCHTIVNNKGNIGRLYDKWVDNDIQKSYLELLNQFEV